MSAHARSLRDADALALYLLTNDNDLTPAQREAYAQTAEAAYSARQPPIQLAPASPARVLAEQMAKACMQGFDAAFVLSLLPAGFTRADVLSELEAMQPVGGVREAMQMLDGMRGRAPATSRVLRSSAKK